MLVMIHDRYYRDSPETVRLTAFVDPKEESRLLCSVTFKASHAPEASGDRSRPPQDMQIVFQGEALTAWLGTTPDQQPLHAEADALRGIIRDDGKASTTSKRWRGLTLRVEAISRQALVLKVLDVEDRCLMTLFWPLGVWAGLRRAVYNMRQRHEGRSAVLSWECEPYVTSLPATAQLLD